ncbi:DEAD-box ATP-dependent RNA helicase 10 [Apostasia shenzhenica]|uniref:DEAD-box ATP-dependent RNA helicase 10 n=1 Tax=Apostasia shenzhenica TaxID=1088818 RepID=A0A2I0BBZ4_9ASPA|nr:DEAD-box ATP-dependent RNA helicase 10 [Apostasia shenzhenica]
MSGSTSMVFTRTCDATRLLALLLRNLGLKAIPICGQMSQDYIHRVGRTARAGRSEEAEVLLLLERVSDAKRISQMKMKESAGNKKRKKSEDADDEDAERYAITTKLNNKLQNNGRSINVNCGPIAYTSPPLTEEYFLQLAYLHSLRFPNYPLKSAPLTVNSPQPPGRKISGRDFQL